MNVLLALMVFSAGFSDPVIPNGEKIVYQGYDDGNHTSREITREIHDEGEYYYTIHNHHDTTRIVVKCKVRKQNLSTLEIVKNRSGRFQLSIEPITEGIQVKDGFKDKQRKVKHKGKFFDRHSLIDVFRGFPFDNPQTIEFAFFEAFVGMVVTGTCTYGGVYDVKTDADEFRCHKLTLGFKSKFIETAYRIVLAGRSFDFYYEVNEPHRLVLWTDNKGSFIKLLRVESEGQ